MRAAARLSLALASDVTAGVLAERLAAVHGASRVMVNGRTYGQVAADVERWAGSIAATVEPGDRVVVDVGNSEDAVLMCLAVARAGGVAVPVNAQARADEVEHVIRDAAAARVVRAVAECEGASGLTRPVPRAAGDLAALFYTSGTTGTPKGVQLTHRGLLDGVRRGALLVRPPFPGPGVAALSLAHIMGFVTVLGFACAGVPLVFLSRFRADDVLDELERRRASVFVGVPAMYRLLWDAGAERRDLSSVRLWISGADRMPPDLAGRFRRLGATVTLPGVGPLGDAVFVEGYGMVELAGAVAVGVQPPGVLVPVPGFRLRVVDERGRSLPVGGEGELQVRGPGVTTGYRSAPEATAELFTPDGWLRTGDLARRLPVGVRVTGRVKDVIKRGGFSVYPAEVEHVLAEVEGVAEVAVVGRLDERFGEVPVAVVRVQPGADAQRVVAGVEALAEARLTPYKRPVAVIVSDEPLPRTHTGKVRRAHLAASLG